MNNAKVWILITGIVTIISGFLLYSMIRSREVEKASFLVKIQELTGRLAEVETLKIELAQVQKERVEQEAKSQIDIAALEAQIGDSKKSEALLKTRVDALLKEKETMTKYMENNGAIVAKLNKKIESLEKELDQALSDAKTESDSLASQFVDPMADPAESALGVSATKQAIGAKLAKEEIVDLGRIIVHPSTHEPARVENVNPLYGFIVLSAGMNDGLKKDSVVNITRNNRLIAKAVVKKSREDVSSAVTLPEWTREEIRVGDLVSINSPSLLPTA